MWKVDVSRRSAVGQLGASADVFQDNSLARATKTLRKGGGDSNVGNVCFCNCIL